MCADHLHQVSAITGNFRSWLNAGLAFVYPEACQLCGVNRAKLDEGLVCSRCWQQVRFIRPPYCDRCGLPFEGDITTTFECANCREMELHFTSARSAVVAGGVVLVALLIGAWISTWSPWCYIEDLARFDAGWRSVPSATSRD